MALPEVTTHQDRLLTVNVNEVGCLPTEMPGVTITPLFLDRENGVWVLYGKFEPGTVLPTHFHTGTVHFYTTKGAWNYLEYPQDPQTAGSYLYEPGGSIHTFSVPADAKGLNGEYHSIMDAGAIEAAVLGAVKAGAIPMPKYIRPKGGAEFSTL